LCCPCILAPLLGKGYRWIVVVLSHICIVYILVLLEPYF